MTPSELEQWVLLASNVTISSQQRWEATNLLNAWLESKDKEVVPCLFHLVSSREETVQFYALTTLQRTTLSLPERVELRSVLLQYAAQQDYLKTKAAIVLALLIKTDFPAQWPLAFDEVRSKASREFFLRTLQALMEDLLTNSDDDATRVKDAMRGLGLVPPIAITETISARVVDWLVELLAESYPHVINPNGSQDEAQVICALSFQVLKRLVSWIDVGLVVQDRALSFIFCGIELAQPSIAVPAVESLQELVGRGMADDKKIQMLQQLDLLNRIHNSRVDLDTVDASPIEVVIEVAKLIYTTGLELLTLWDSSQCDALNTLLQQLMNLFFRCFAYDDIDVSGAVIPLASRLTVTLGKEQKGGSPTNGDSSRFTVSPHLPQLLAIMFRQMRYPSDFEFDYEDEDEAEEEVYRRELRKLNQSLVRMCPDLCLQFLCEALSNLPVPISTCPTPDIEAALRLVYHYCEGIRPPPGMKVVMRNETFRTVLVALHQSDVTSHYHREVLLLYYDICVRYYPIFKDKPELLPNVLESISGVRGLQHPHARVRSRSCYLLLRLVKSIASVLRPYVETAVAGIQGLLSNPSTYPLRPDDTLYLFETIGLLLGKTGLDASEQQKHLAKVMTPHACSIEEALRSAELPCDPEHFGTLLSGSIAAIAYLSKGFNKPPPEVQVVLLETVTITLGVLEALPGNERVRNKTMVLLQRMIQCLGNKVLPTMPRFLHLLIENCTTEDVLDVAQLLNQLCSKFKEEAVPAIDAAVLPFLRKCHSLMPATGDVVAREDTIPPHLLTEQLSIKKLTFAFLQYVVTHRATTVLLTATNVNALESILQTMYEGVSAVQDPVMKKSCIVFFRELVEQWADPSSTISNENAVVQRGFCQFVFETFVPGMIKCMLSPDFNEHDAMQARNVSEMANVLDLLKTKRGTDEFERFVVVGALSTVQCPPNVLQGFQVATGAREMELCLKEIIKSLKPQKVTKR